MGNYSLSTRAQFDLVGIYKYGIKFFGSDQATKYLYEFETFLEELAERSELVRDASPIANSLKYYRYKAHVVFFQFNDPNNIYVIRILGKRMNFVEHL